MGGGPGRPVRCWPPDISSAILRYAADAATRAGLANVLTSEMDGEELDVAPAAFDAVISRLGLIYFPDQWRALAGMYRMHARPFTWSHRRRRTAPGLAPDRHHSIYQRP